ncbi:C-type lectin domain-containing protein 161 [Caenorhabditis elegans]|uniref:C-type lectin domain-containing protein 161 n=1 Tax=Caenorhabditis elegans TaxID=6239 RepID=CL161_CAEEL|nr:C-type lectin domain-containing protein 161 [Caenorhabditis elegans]P34472.3 RecName: Full=C-type lectin domain-containing protein 161; Flags: Precursor [Caenorhabditis elegans]CAA80162.3 C-type lectin domain-containing protein 161 [Caenorhabditis elegans]|eukprot:NP_499125.3 C-type lectin domain-containing protein 161 [Caenorhabditis elegans]
MYRRTTLWFLLLFQPILVFAQNRTELYECKIGTVNPLASTSLNACFKLYNTPKSFQAARRYCVSLGGQLADKINKDDSSLYSANADLEVANSTKFWVGASNLKCNIAWENGGEIEFNDMWAPESRYYGVAIDKMSIGGLWHTVPVGQKLPFVCTFQGKSNEAGPAPVHAMRAPAKKRVPKVEKPEEKDIDESLNAALSDKKEKKEVASDKKKESKKDEEDINESMNAALSDERKKSASLASSDKKESSKKDESSDEANLSASQVANAEMSASISASSANSSSDESSDEAYDSAEIEMRKKIGKTVIAMKSQEMASQSDDYDKYTEEDLLSAAASLIGGYILNAHWADSRTTNTSSFDSQTDEETLNMMMAIAEQIAMTMRSSKRRESSSSNTDSESASISESSQASEQAVMAAAMSAKSSKKSESSSKDESEDSASLNLEQKASAAASAALASKSKSDSSDQSKDQKSANVALAVVSENKHPTKKPEDPKSTKTTTEEPDIDESLNAALANQRSTTTKNSDLTTIITTVKPNALPIAIVAKQSEKDPACPAEWTQFNTNATAPALCFKRYEKPMNFEDARLFCVGKGGHLASIHNERQLLLLSALLHNNGPDALSDQTWIGLNRIHQKYYVYEDETAMDFTRWLPGAPNINDCTVFTGNELPNYPHKGTQYKFGDFPCEEVQKSVLCEVTLGKDKLKSQTTCQDGWSYYSHDGTAKNGKCYKRIDQSKKFSEAREVCKVENSYVASVQNEGEARFVSALVQTEKNYTVDEQTWIGYVKYDRDFGWEDGNKGLQFDPWTEKMPRQKKCTVFTGNEIHENCRSQFRFVSVDCNKTQRSVLCSKPPMKNGTPFVYKDTDNSSKKI